MDKQVKLKKIKFEKTEIEKNLYRRGGMPVQWYLLKTWVGKEEELVQVIGKTVPACMYKECFVIKQERIWRKQQKNVIHIELLFPGCVFLTCERARTVSCRIEHIPALSGFTACNRISILPMMKEDADFLEKISGKEHVVKLSYVGRDEQGNISKLSEPLKICQPYIERLQFKKRYAMIHHRLWGEEQVIVMGIVLKEDIHQAIIGEDRVTEEMA